MLPAEEKYHEMEAIIAFFSELPPDSLNKILAFQGWKK